MDARSRKLHDIEKQSVLEEPKEAKMLIESDKEMQLHRMAMQVLERHVKDIEDFKNNLDGSTCPLLSDADQALVDASNTFILRRFMLLFQEFGKAFVYYGNPTAEWQFWIRLLWLIEETQKYAVQSMAENEVFDAPDFFNLCAGEQDERLKPVYDKWDKTLFSEESFKRYLSEALEKRPMPKLSPEEIAEMERQEQEDVEFDKRVLAEKCPTCPKPCEWYKQELENQKNE
jgi:hypothetical protein